MKKINELVDRWAQKLYYRGTNSTVSSNLDYAPKWNEVPDIIKEALRKEARDFFLLDPDLALIEEAYFKYPRARRQRLHVIPLAEALEEKK